MHSPKLIFSEAFEALGGYRREEAIMLLRKFYLTENVHGKHCFLGSVSITKSKKELRKFSLLIIAPAPRDKSKRGMYLPSDERDDY
jgi:hypothetical protein